MQSGFTLERCATSHMARASYLQGDCGAWGISVAFDGCSQGRGERDHAMPGPRAAVPVSLLRVSGIAFTLAGGRVREEIPWRVCSRYRRALEDLIGR